MKKTRMDEAANKNLSSKRRRRPTRPQDIFPLCFTYSVIILSWIGFVSFIVINDAFLQRHSPIRAGILFLASGVLFALTILSLLTASTRPPGEPDPDLTPEGARESQERKEWDEDDIPLGQLRRSRRTDLSIEARQDLHGGSTGEDVTPSSGTSGHSLEVSPFPLQVSPFVPTTATDAGEDEEDPEEGRDVGTDKAATVMRLDAEGDKGDEEGLLNTSKRGHRSENRRSLFAKNSSGGHRWCSKCDAWKPDRCHHCRFCKQCTLKMDHHCVWIGTCVGYHTYKPFLLFINYGASLALFILINSGLSMIHYFTHPEDYTSHSPSGMEVGEFTPISFILMTFMGAFFTLTIGGLAGYHWTLVISNKTTLEDITHTYPSALIEDQRHDVDDQSGWRGDHLLSRSERVRLREEAAESNVYDLGWRRNIREVFMGSRRSNFKSYISCFWPLAMSRDRAGHYFDYDPNKLERLRDLTLELRFGRRAPGDTET